MRRPRQRRISVAIRRTWYDRGVKTAAAWFGLCVGAGLSLVSASAQAWGDEGHRTVGELAFGYLSPEARERVREALTERGYETLAEAATWPDTYARRHSEYDAMKPFHYVNVDARAQSYSQARDCPNGCVVTALTQFIALLQMTDPPPTLSERRNAIYWVAHFMGDIHQPLHVAHPDGKGGTATLLNFFEARDKRSAHWIWDFGLIERRPAPPPGASASTGAEDFHSLAAELAHGLSPTKRRAFGRTLSPEAIANETLLLSRRRAFLSATDRVDAAYEQSRWPVVAEQLQKAGVRLAEVLERALVQPAPQKPAF